MSKAPTAVVLAAGQGTRMRSRTPKVLHDLCGRPMVCWPVQAALSAGVGEVIVVDSPARALAQALPDGVRLVVQERPDGTGGAVIAAREHLDRDSSIVVLSADVPLVSAAAIQTLIAAHAQSGAAASIASTVLEDPGGYGRVVRGNGGELARIVETKQAGDASEGELVIKEVNSGIYVFDGGALLDTLGLLTCENAQGEFYLPQTLELLRAQGAKIAAHRIDDERLVLGVNDGVQLARVRSLAQQAINERHMRAGVSIIDPASTYIDVDVQIGPDTVIEPSTTIKGAARVGRGCTIRYSYLQDCLLEDGVTVGPFAYLRPGTVLRENAKAGTFVEVKNSDIGQGAKVPHLSYIGDADVGAGTNLGAATITANYDGRAKHRTKIGKDVHTSVDTTLVAPVDVGDGAYTGAGSVITEDVPPGALGIARAHQSNIEGYAERREEPPR